MERYAKNKKKMPPKLLKITAAVELEQMSFTAERPLTPDKIRLVPFEKKDQWTQSEFDSVSSMTKSSIGYMGGEISSHRQGNYNRAAFFSTPAFICTLTELGDNVLIQQEN